MTEIYRHRFVISDITLTAGKNYNIEAANIGGIQFQHDYLARRLPVIKLKMSMTEDMIKILYDNVDTAKLSLSIAENQLDDNDNIIGTKQFIHDTFDIVPSTSVDTYDTITTDDVFNDIDPDQDILTLYLIKSDRIVRLDKEVAAVFTGTDKAAALQSLFSMRDIPARTCIITPPLSNDKVDTMIVPLGNLVSNIDTLNVEYGLWSSNAVLFDDYRYLYCIDRNNPNIVMNQATDFDTVVFKLANQNDAMRVATGSSTDPTTKCHYVNLTAEPSVEDNTKTTTQMEFGTIAAVNSNGAVTKTTVDATTPKMLFVRERNSLTVDQYINERISNPIDVTLTANDTALSIFKPYKIYRFDIGNTTSTSACLVGKVFRITSVTMSLMKRQDYFRPTAIITLSVLS